jgi:O-antigen ligase/tetratricopeptide (TPR) repeat protein
VGYAGVLLVSAALGKSLQLTEIVGAFGMISLPVFFAVAPRHFLPRRLAGMLGILWGVNTVHSLIQVAVGTEVVALAGNRNWGAATLACLLPWVWLGVAYLPKLWRWLLAVLSTGLTLWLVWLCQSRAVWLAVGLYVVCEGLRRLPSVWRWATVLAGVALVLACGFLARGRLAKVAEEDIRPPLYMGTLRMVVERPILGVGPGNFRREYAGRRSREHLSRRVAADVTEHPHNELLRMAAEMGVPVALVWTALIAFAIFWIGPGRRPSQRACHYSAFVLFAHGMLDKPLVMPPTSLLAVLFVGLLLRWRLPVRLTGATGGRLMMQGVLAVLMIGLGGYLTVVEVSRGALFRRAALAEDAGENEKAYEAFALACRIDPRDVRTHAYAGICANNRLRKPELALPHLVRAWELEPNFAHVNGEIGRALGRSGNHQEAVAFFFREAELYPFHLSSWRDLFVCGLQTGGMIDLMWVQDQICDLRLQRVEEVLRQMTGDGEQEARKLAAAFALAAEGGEPGQEEEALTYAKFLAADLSLTVLEGQRPPGDLGQYGPDDIRFWQVRLKWRNAWLHCREDAPALLEAWNRVPGDWRLAGFAEFAESAGWRALVVETVPECIEIQRAEGSFLVVPSGGSVQPGTIESLVADEALQKRLGVRFPSERIGVRLAFGELRLYERTQHLGYVLHRLLPASMPEAYRSPYAAYYAVRYRFRQSGLKVQVGLEAIPE